MILVRNLTKIKIPRSFLGNAKKLFWLLKIPQGVEISLVFAGPELMRRLNRRWRRKSRPGDVLSFGSPPKERKTILATGRGMLGEIFICPAIARTEAKTSGIKFDQQLTRLLIHAILHLLGYTHASSRDTKKMQRREQEVLKKISQ